MPGGSIFSVLVHGVVKGCPRPPITVGVCAPLICFIKAWKYFKDVPISSFYVELRVAKYAAAEAGIVYEIDVQRIFSQLWDIQLAAMQDPEGIGGYIRPCTSDATLADAL